MRRRFFSPILCLAVTMLLITASHLHAFQVADTRSVASLQHFFEEIVHAKNFSLPPENTNLNDVERQIPDADPEEISKALPIIFTALSHPNEEVRWCGISALTMISMRSDSKDLLKGHIGKIAELWNASDSKLQGAPAAILNNVNLETYSGIVPRMLQFIRRTDRAPEAQSSTLYILAKSQPSNPEAIQIVNEFLSRSLDTATRINTLNAVSLARMSDSQTRRSIIRSLDDAHPGVKLAAIKAITRIGQDALDEATPRLSELATSNSEGTEVKAAAFKALKRTPDNIPIQ